mmetsp:Transcript_42696/g.96188  ORF Transcript_42696/g.96188 Transcript_42696/m.96188 type:complete len:253 (+) Transcript_42696:224-982(+)
MLPPREAHFRYRRVRPTLHGHQFHRLPRFHHGGNLRGHLPFYPGYFRVVHRGGPDGDALQVCRGEGANGDVGGDFPRAGAGPASDEDDRDRVQGGHLGAAAKLPSSPKLHAAAGEDLRKFGGELFGEQELSAVPHFHACAVFPCGCAAGWSQADQRATPGAARQCAAVHVRFHQGRAGVNRGRREVPGLAAAAVLAQVFSRDYSGAAQVWPVGLEYSLRVQRLRLGNLYGDSAEYVERRGAGSVGYFALRFR